MRAAVLGAGLQGACVAMELAADGCQVDLYDKNENCVSKASARNEGKIHLGYVYANDRKRSTARLMIRGALTFSRLLRRWIGSDIQDVPVSSPFYYAVHKQSLLSVEEVEQHLAACSSMAQQETRGDSADYFGMDVCQPPVRMRNFGGLFDSATIAAAFQTQEIAIDPEALAGKVRARIAADPNIRCILRANVLDVGMGDAQGVVHFDVAGQRSQESYDYVVNTLWDGRLAIDNQVGLRPPRPWLYRMKYFLRGRTVWPAPPIPSTTIVLGPFGDTVSYASGEKYLSWYPSGMLGVSADLSPPCWPDTPDAETAARLRRAICTGLAKVIPALGGLDEVGAESLDVQGGVIFAWGSTDIDALDSSLHSRTQIGLDSLGRYHSINTGKFTMAPLFAKMTADRIRLQEKRTT